MRNYYSVSFNSYVKNDKAYVNNWCSLNIFTNKFDKGNGINSLMNFMLSKPSGCRFYFHGLSFYGKFIVYKLLNEGYKNANYEEYKNNIDKTFIINSNQEVWYTLKIRYNNKNIKILDSKCKLNLTLEGLKSAYGIETIKGSLKDKVNVVAKSLLIHFNEGDTELTSSSDALKAYINMFGGMRRFRMYAPILNDYDDSFARDSVMGAFLYCNKLETGEGFSMDRNSQYSYIMRDFRLPIGKPKYYEGNDNFKFNPNKCYIIKLTFTGILKDGKLPFIPEPYNITVDDLGNKYVDAMYERRLTLCLPDFILLLENYNVDKLTIDKVAEYESNNGMFTDYVNHYGKIKELATETNNKGLRQIAKMKLNGLFGKFLQQKFPGSPTVYSPIGTYILSYSRYLIIKAAQLDINHFVYSDTDSIHFDCQPEDIKWDPRYAEFDDKEIGKFKIEFRFKKSRHLWIKEYMLLGYDGETKTAMAGVAKQRQSEISYDDFKHGTTIKDAVTSTKIIEGGCYKVKYDFKL